MSSYYREVIGHLQPGNTAKSSDINHIQEHVRIAVQQAIADLTDSDPYALGHGDDHKDDFLLTPASKKDGKYIDSDNVFEINKSNYINVNRYDIKQPLPKTKTSLYSVFLKMKNTSNRNIPIYCEIQDERGEVLRKNKVVLAKETEIGNYEVIFDLNYYPTAIGFDYNDLQAREGKDLPPANSKEESYDEGYQTEHQSEEEIENKKKPESLGVSKLYLVIKRANVNALDLYDGDDEPVFDPDTSLGVYCQDGSPFPDKKIYAYIKGDSNVYSPTEKNIYYQDVYAVETTYICENGGSAIINGEPVDCIDTHVSVEGASTQGNVLSIVYMDKNGHLKYVNSEASLSTDIEDFNIDLDDPLPPDYYPIAAILTYSNDIYGTAKEPKIIQDNYGDLLIRPRSHHERIRRLEKKVDWTKDLAVPSRIKYNLTGENIVNRDENTELDGIPQTVKVDNITLNPDKVANENIVLTTDSLGNGVIRLTQNPVQNYSVTLKEKITGADGKALDFESTDKLNVSAWSKKENMVHDSKKGTIMLDKVKYKTSRTGSAITEEEAKSTEFYLWDDAAANRLTKDSLKHLTTKERIFTVYKGDNKEKDTKSHFPALTFYTDKNYKITKFDIPVKKFKDCSGVKFIIRKRQDSNDKENNVKIDKKTQTLYTSKEFSLEKARTSGGFQYQDKGFRINFGEDGLELEKGQYIFIILPIPKSDSGSVYLTTIEPKNSRDFLIDYTGTENASWMKLTNRYQEVLFNSTKMTVEQEKYADKGVITSKTLKFEEPFTDTNIKSIKPIVGKNLTVGKNCSYKLYVNIGGKWQQVTPGKENTINSGNGKSFTWRLEFHSNDGKNTPKLSYNSKQKYAIKFVIKRQKLSSTKSSTVNDINGNMCITSKTFDADKILRDYVGDLSLGYENSKFSYYEFARIWADDEVNKGLMIDMQASDKELAYNENNPNEKTTLWTMHYCGLTLDDFEKINVDYSDYTEDIEPDEHNLNLKLKEATATTDDYIIVNGLDTESFDRVANEIDDTLNSKIHFVNQKTSTTSESEDGANKEENKTMDNQLFLRRRFEAPVDLTKYTGLKFGFTIESNVTEGYKGKLKGLAVYFSNTWEEEVPSDIKNRPETKVTLQDEESLPDIIDPDVSSADFYDGQTIGIIHENSEEDGNKASSRLYFRYIKVYDESLQKFVYKKEQVYDTRSYRIFKANSIVYEKIDDDSDNEANTKDNDPCKDAAIVRVEIDQDSSLMKNVKEIGIITLNDEEIYEYEVSKIDTSNSNDSNEPENTTEYYLDATLCSVKAMDESTLTIFNPISKRDDLNFIRVPTAEKDNVILQKKLKITSATYNVGNDTYWNNPNTKKIPTRTDPKTQQITIKHKNIGSSPTTLCYINNPYFGRLTKYKHISIRIASDVYIPKDCLKVNICAKVNGEDIIESINLPTFNTVYAPLLQHQTIIMNVVYGRITSVKQIKSISITTTKYFKEFMNKVVDNDAPAINLYLGKIALLRADTVPIFERKMRFKFYSTTNGEIDHDLDDNGDGAIEIRKIGAVLDYG